MELVNASPSTSLQQKSGVEIGVNGGRSTLMAGVAMAGAKLS
jgi:hypothetical protein